MTRMNVIMDKFVRETPAESMSEIQSFFKDASVFITGATGFLGHVLLAKLIRSCPDVKKIYILLRSKKGKCVSQRFQELLQDEVFEVLRVECPEATMKVHPIAGDCLLSKLGINEADEQLLKSEVNVIFHVAATVKFDAPLKYAVNMNIRSTGDLLNMAHDMKQLKAFVHVSTAFSNCVDRTVIEEKFYSSPISADQLMTLVENLDEKIIDNITPSLLGTYPNTYVFTKGVAEGLCRTRGVGLPLTIFRPAIVISTVKEPIPGWINNIYGPTGVVAAAAVGLLHVLQVDPNKRANVVPCDYVVNAAIASAWNVGTKSDQRNNNYTPNGSAEITKKNILHINTDKYIPNGALKSKQDTQNSCNDEDMPTAEGSDGHHIPIYNFSCDLIKEPYTWAEFMKVNSDIEPEVPSCQSIWAFSLLLVKNKTMYQFYCLLLHTLPAFLADNVARLIGKKPKLTDAYQKLHKLNDVLSYFSTREWIMMYNNVHSLWDNLSEKDKNLFDFDLQNIEWVEYYRQHCHGIRKFILKEDPKTIPSAQKRRLVLLFLHKLLVYALTLSSLYIIFKVVIRLFLS